MKTKGDIMKEVLCTGKYESSRRAVNIQKTEPLK